jgi:imidazolonepropionase-like amidohydrolase
LHEELALLIRTGMSPAEALHSATAGAAALLRADSIGTLKVGAVADFVVLTASPLDDIRNTRQVEAIVARGRRYSPMELRSR